MTHDGIEKMANNVISKILYGHRPLSVYQISVELYCKVEYYNLGMLLNFEI